MTDRINTLTVRNAQQKALFEAEIKGQLSDGFWKMAVPLTHWKLWSRSEVVVAEEDGNVGTDFYPTRDRYNFTNSEFLSYVGDCMLNAARLSFFIDDVNDIMAIYDHFDGDGNITPPTTEGEYWDAQRAIIKRVVTPEVAELMKTSSYTMTDMRKDLRDLSAIVKMRNW